MRNTIVNCTPHNIVVQSSEFCEETGEWLLPQAHTFPASGNIARLNIVEVKEDAIYLSTSALIEFKVESASTTGISGLPDPEVGTIYLVSAMVLSYGKEIGRNDLMAPNTNKAKRNEAGHIIGVPGFVV